MKRSKNRIETDLVHAGEPHPRIKGAVTLPVFQSATYEYEGQDNYHDIGYIRLNNTPNHQTLHAKLAAVESAEDALVTASGMAAISTALLTILKNGDHLLIQDCLYGGTHDLVTKDIGDFGIEYDFIDGNNPDSWREKIKPNTRAIYFESVSNPLLGVPDLESAVQFARENKLISLIDNTFPSPINFRPIELGFDLVLHSCTKYLNGHSDIVGGACIGKLELVTKIRHKLNHLGGCMDPHAAFLLYRGMKTLALRVRHQNDSAQRLAEMLEKHDAVAKIFYPGLNSHPQHERAEKLFDGFGGMLSFELKNGTADAANQLMEALKLPVCAPSLGGVESLITRPSTTSHAGISADYRRTLGIADGLLRVSVGIENPEDLLEDFSQALNQVAHSKTKEYAG